MEMTPVLKRVSIARILGLVLGLIYGAIFLQATSAPATLIWGLILWAITLGAIIGLVGFVNRAPFFDMALPAWMRGAWCGAWMGLVLVLLAYAPLQAAMAELSFVPAVFRSVWWIVVDAAIAGLLIDVIASWLAGRVNWRGSGLSDRAHA